MADCLDDYDRHGWRRVYAVSPDVGGRAPERGPVVGPSGNLARYGLYDDRSDADAAAATLRARGIPALVSAALIDNERAYTELVDPVTLMTVPVHNADNRGRCHL